MTGICRHVVITGRVQGVGYRAWTEDAAAERRLRGWVRNRRDGTVEAVFIGPDSVVTEMIDACRQGPRSAHVTRVEVRDATADDLAQSNGRQTTGKDFLFLPTL
ncbi:MAG: acylphosphatase [Pseudolabrys sp.]|nr:acylphosphatase [Pseudolabrys sp.]